MKNPHGNGGAFASYRAKLLAELDTARGNILAEADVLLGKMEYPKTQGIMALLVTIKIWIDTFLKQYEGLLEKFSGHRDERGGYFRRVQLDHGVDTPYVPRSWAKTLMPPQITATLEALVVGILMISGGHMTVAAGFSYAAIFSLANVLIGMMAGYFGLRFAVFKSRADNLDPYDLKIRRRGKALFIGMASLLGVMTFVAGRVRATGGHEAIFDFGEVSFFAGYNDAMAIMITVIACASSFIAIYEGYKIDPIAGLSEAYRYANDIDTDVGDFVGRTGGTLDDRFLPAIDQAYDALDAIDAADKARKDGLPKINGLRRNFNQKIDAAKNTLALVSQKEVDRYQRITGKTMGTSPDLGLQAFDDLKLSMLIEADILDDSAEAKASADELRALVSEVEALHQDALAKVDADHAAYLATGPSLSPVTEPKGVPA